MMEKSWKEEIAHGEKLIDYVIKRGGIVQTPSVSVSL
jgi:ferritin